MTEFHVAPSGDDAWPGTPDRPFATLERAGAAARETAGDVVVSLRGGTHTRTAPWQLTGPDSARDGHRIVYQAHGYGTAAQERVVVGGGREISGWRVEDGVWLADVGDLDTRQLHVGGRRAERASIAALPGAVTPSETGYLTDSAAPLSWRDPSGVELVYRGLYPWTEARCGVADVSPGPGGGSVITMVQPGFGHAMRLYNYAWGGQETHGPGLPTRVENDAAFLTEPGTFVLDRTRPGHHLLSYLPRPDESPESTRVVAPVLETLLRVTGTRGVSFRGLVFADATWLRPSGPGGFLHYHGSSFYEGGPVSRASLGDGAWVTYPDTSRTIDACVELSGVSGVEFEGCTFTRLGGTGLGVSGGAGVTVRGCEFHTLSAAAVSVTGTREVLIEDNRVRDTGLDYSGSPGIELRGTKGCTVAHNEVSDVPHCGIVAGTGEGTRILRNRTTRTMGVLADGGGVYLSGPQGDSAANGAEIRGNVIKDTRTPYNFALYTDYGAAWVTVEGNVVARADNTSVLRVSPPLENVVYRGNFWDADPLGADDPPEGVTYEGNTTLPVEADLDAATRAIQARAGLLRPRA